MKLIEHKYILYFIFSTIYLHQGFIEVFMYIYMALYLASLGLSILVIGLTIAIGTAPWIFKILYGIVSDRKGSKRWGRRIPYMTVGTFFGAILFFMLISINPFTAWILFTSVIFAANLFNAFCDTSTDGLLVDTTNPEKRGKVQSLCWGSKLFGYVIAALLFGFIVEIFSWTIYFLLMGIFLLLPIPLLIFSREPPYKIPEKFPWKDLKNTFKMRLVWNFLIFIIIVNIGIFIIFSMLPLFLSLELELDLSLVGIVMAMASMGFLIGTLVSGPIYDKLSRRMSLLISIVFLTIAMILISMIQKNILMALIFIMIGGFAWGFFTISEMIVSMDLSKKSISATVFSFYMSISNLGTAIGAIIGAFLVEIFGYRIAFICAAFIILSTIILAIFIKDTEKLFIESSEILNE